ncbi:hypothetical protein ABPG74_020780 [Tetrahymena malaccensis]
MDGSSSSLIRRPFIIRGKKEEFLIPENDSHFDQSVESKVSFTQACNWFISFILTYESVKQFYYVFYYEGKCSDYSRIMIYYMLANGFWVLISIVGAALIRSKQSKKIFIFFILLIITFISRIVIYILMYDTMNHYISDATLQDCYCRSIYVEDLYMLQAIVEGLILLVMIVFVKIIHKYIQSYEQKDREQFFGPGASGGNLRPRFIGNSSRINNNN